MNIKLHLTNLLKVALSTLFMGILFLSGVNAESNIKKNKVEKNVKIKKSEPSLEKSGGCIPFRISMS
jgi:hypothetical protein